MNELQRNAAIAALESQPRSAVAALAVEKENRLQRVMNRMRRMAEDAGEVTMEAVKVVGVVGGSAIAGFVETKLPDYETIGETGIPTVGAVGAAAVVGSMLPGMPKEAGGIIRSVGAGMLGVAAYKLVKGM
jgi:hypothetical protein